ASVGPHERKNDSKAIGQCGDENEQGRHRDQQCSLGGGLRQQRGEKRGGRLRPYYCVDSNLERQGAEQAEWRCGETQQQNGGDAAPIGTQLRDKPPIEGNIADRVLHHHFACTPEGFFISAIARSMITRARPASCAIRALTNAAMLEKTKAVFHAALVAAAPAADPKN